MNAVRVVLGAYPNNFEPKWGEVRTDVNGWALFNGNALVTTMPTNANLLNTSVRLRVNTPALTGDLAEYAAQKYLDLLNNATYTISGIAGKIMGRTVTLGDLEVEVYTEETSAYTVEISDNKIFNDPSAPVIRLALKSQPAVGADAGKFSKTFAVADKFGTYYDLRSATFTGDVTAKIVHADGSKASVAVGSTIDVAVAKYAIRIDPTTNAETAHEFGLVFDLKDPIANAEAGDKLQVTIPKVNFVQIGETNTAATQAKEDITFEFVIAE